MPIFTVSSVTGEGLNLLTRFLYVLPPSISIKEKERLEQVKIFTCVLTIFDFCLSHFLEIELKQQKKWKIFKVLFKTQNWLKNI